MATGSDPFYGCLCLETASNVNGPIPPIRSRRSLGILLPEIHFNIWEKDAGDGPLLDIGLMLSVDEPAERIEIFLPWVLDVAEIEDLSARVLARNGVSAIFNESWTTSSTPNNLGGYVTRDDGSIFTIVPFSPVVLPRNHNSNLFNSVIVDVAQLKTIPSVFSTNRALDQIYVRFRVKKVPPEFYQVGIDQGDVFGGGALNRTDIIDFRMNVRRGVPPGLETLVKGRFLEFSKVQLFLMKPRDQDIVFEDKLFKACRSLEDEKFWAEYILPAGATQSQIKKSLKQVQGSLGYQWKKSAPASVSEISEFGMLARFKSFKMKKRTITLFLILALGIGVLGNLVYDFGKSMIEEKSERENNP
ncbi:hypothetical protein GTP45_26030 [Pseudoduganella sp. FT55W]|uniref:Uncharacterized protein n=1 Tax=Duganella rivi TaxID=2666083 RepID=A0A7X4KF87_9BURK|nr:hypothetical protein [Duganella rivi]MYM70238.1 hypothetical protein [Duganella rivi]